MRLGNERFQVLALLINSAQEVVHLAVDLSIDLVEMPCGSG